MRGESSGAIARRATQGDPMPDTTELLQQGIALAKAGRRDEARTVLMQVVEQDERTSPPGSAFGRRG